MMDELQGGGRKIYRVSLFWRIFYFATWDDVERIEAGGLTPGNLILRRFTFKAGKLMDWWLGLIGQQGVIPLFIRGGLLWEKGITADLFHYARI